MFRQVLRSSVSSSLISQVPRVSRVSPSLSVIRTATPFVRLYSEEAKKDEKSTGEETKAEETTQDVDEVTKLKQEVEAAKKETATFKDNYLRSVADFRNLQESTKREIQKSKDLALKSFAKDLLETADTFEIALKTLTGEEAATADKKANELDELIKGVELTQNLFLNTLKRHGLEKIEPIGEKFDPNVHEATFEVPQPDKEPGTVFFVQQPGYFLNKRVLRPAKVGIVKGSE